MASCLVGSGYRLSGHYLFQRKACFSSRCSILRHSAHFWVSASSSCKLADAGRTCDLSLASYHGAFTSWGSWSSPFLSNLSLEVFSHFRWFLFYVSSPIIITLLSVSCFALPVPHCPLHQKRTPLPSYSPRKSKTVSRLSCNLVSTLRSWLPSFPERSAGRCPAALLFFMITPSFRPARLLLRPALRLGLCAFPSPPSRARRLSA